MHLGHACVQTVPLRLLLMPSLALVRAHGTKISAPGKAYDHAVWVSLRSCSHLSKFISPSLLLLYHGVILYLKISYYTALF